MALWNSSPAKGFEDAARSWRPLMRHLSHQRRWQAAGVIGLMLLGAVAELLTLGTIIPFLAAIAKPDEAGLSPRLLTLLHLSGVHTGPSRVRTLAVSFSVVVVVAAILRVALAWASQRLVFWVGHDLGLALYRHILCQPYRYHLEHSTSEAIATMDKVPVVVNGALLPLMQAMIASILAVFLLTGMLLINAGAALTVGLGLAAIYATISAAARRRLHINGARVASAFTQRIRMVQEGIGGIRDVLLDRSQPVYLANFERMDADMRNAQASNAMIAATPRFVIEALGMIAIALVATTMSLHSGGLVNAVPSLAALALGAQRLLPLLQTIYNGATQVGANAAAVADIVAALDPHTKTGMLREIVTPLSFNRAVSFSNVHFSYRAGDREVLTDLSFTIRKGIRVGVVGSSGAGKSTVMDLLMGLLTPTAGAILIDGEPLSTNNIAAWQAQVAHVPQHVFLSEASFTRNIAFGVVPEAIDQERVRWAALLAQLDPVISRQPNGYDTLIGETGLRLSGGQRQRVGLARALYKRASLLILDEATSALDEATEAAIADALKNLGRAITVVIVAHRRSALRDCDVILGFEHGRLLSATPGRATDGAHLACAT